MHQSITVPNPPQAAPLVSDVMLADHYARRLARREGVPHAAIIVAARSALASHGGFLDAYRAAETAAVGTAILTGRA